MQGIEETLKQRGARYGAFVEQTRVSQNIKHAMSESVNWKRLAPYQREAFEMCAVKMARILSGDPNDFDSWHDLEGYMKLAADQVGLDEAVGK